MELMVILGVIGFGILFLSDLSGLHKKSTLQKLFAITGTLIIFSSSIHILYYTSRFTSNIPVLILSGTLTITFLILLIYSVVYEVGVKNKEGKLVTTGTYAICRHPGVIWFLLYYVFGSIVFGSTEILVAGIIWSVANIIYVILQEKLVFNKIFDGYENYVKITPMLLPNRNSIKRFNNTLNGGHNERFTSDV